MTARELRNRRRAEERKARKSEQKQLAPLSGPPIPAPTHHGLGVSPETLAEFGPELIAQANSIRDRVHRSAPEPLPTPRAATFSPGQSTGPRSSTGKATSSRNSFKHGLASGQIVVPGEDPAAFDALLADLTTDHAPANSTEELLVHEMAESYWLMQRATRLQTSCFTDGEVDGKQLALFLRYRTTYERAFHKALGTLMKLKKERESAARQFVSQKAPESHRSPQFVSQNNPQQRSAREEAELVSGPKAQGGFVSQTGPHSAHSTEFVRQYDRDCPSFPKHSQIEIRE